MAFIGLYYPYIHFRDEPWLKASALYWDKINRIVPAGMIGQTDDSPTVKLFKDELEFIDDIPPGERETNLVSNVFTNVLETHKEELQKRFHISKKDTWPADATQLRAEYQEKLPPTFDPRLAYIEATKMGSSAHDRLVDSDLAEYLPRFEFGKDWFGMHPKLADVYMTALAQTVARDGRMSPVAERDEDQIAIVEVSLEEMARVLLTDKKKDFTAKYEGQKLTREKLKRRYVQLAFPAVLPKDLNAIDAKKIVKLRKGPYTKAFRAFQKHLDEIASQKRVEELNQITNQVGQDSHVRNQVQKELLEPLEEMKARIGELNNGSVSTVMNVLVQLALVGKTGGFAVASKALQIIPGLAQQRKTANEEIATSPAAFLLHLQENLTPASVLTRTRRKLRKFTYGI